MNAWMGLDTQIYAEKPKNRFEYNEIRKRAANYHPAMCDTFCPYAAACDHDATPVQTLLSDRKVFRLSEPKYYTLEEAERQLEENIASAMQSDRCGIHLIRARQGWGKQEPIQRCLQRMFR